MESTTVPTPAPVTGAPVAPTVAVESGPGAQKNRKRKADAPVPTDPGIVQQRNMLRTLIGTLCADANWFDSATAWRKVRGIPEHGATQAQKDERSRIVAETRERLRPDILARIESFRSQKDVYNDVQGESVAAMIGIKGIPMFARAQTIGQAVDTIERTLLGHFAAQSKVNRAATKAGF